MSETSKNHGLRRLSGIRPSLVFLGHVLELIRFVWPVFGGLVALISALGLVTGVREGWTVGDSFYYAFVTALTIGYGDLAPTVPTTKVLSVVIGLLGFLFTGILVAIAVESVRFTIRGKAPSEVDKR